jgi:O-antigen/teichoic acid export membrane protein
VSTQRFYKATLILGGTNLLIAVLYLARQKIIAHYTGLSGMGVLGLVNSYLFLLYTLGSLAIYPGVTKFISEYRAKNDSKSVSQVWSTSFTITLLFSLILTLLLCLFAKFMSGYFLGNESLSNFFIIVTLSLPFYVLGYLLLAAYKGIQDFKRLAAIQLASVVLSVVLTFFLIRQYNVHGMILSLTFATLILVIVGFLFTSPNERKTFSLYRFQIHQDMLKNLLQFSGTVFTTNLIHFAIQFWVRLQIVKLLGFDKNGAIQAAIYFSVYFQIIQDSIGTYLLPRLSELSDLESVNKELNTSVRLTCLMTIPAIAGLMVFMKPLINILLTSDFQMVGSFVFYIFLADLIRVLYWNAGTYFLAHKELKTSLWTSIVYSLLFGILIYIFIQKWDTLGYAIGYLVANSIMFVITFVCINLKTKFRFQRDNILLLISGLALLLFCNITRQINPWLDLLSVGIIILWTFLSIGEKEWYYLKEKVGSLF